MQIMSRDLGLVPLKGEILELIPAELWLVRHQVLGGVLRLWVLV